MTTATTFPYRVLAEEPRTPDEWAAWRDTRRTGIGSSEMATLFGCGYRTALELYAVKVGALPDEDSDGDFLRMGHRLEPAVREEFSYLSGVECLPWQQTLRSVEHPWAIATPDSCGCSDHDGIGPHVPVEIKTMGRGALSRWEDEGLPKRWRVQVAHQLLVTGGSHGYVAALTADPVFRVLWGRVERDEALLAEIVRRGEEFVARIERRDPPYPTGADADSAALRALYPEALVSEPVALPGEFADLDDEREALVRDLKGGERRKKELDQRLLAAIADAEVGVLPSGVSYRVSRQEVAERVQTVKAHTRHVLYRKEAK